MSRVLSKNHVVTYGYKKGIHDGIDLVGEGFTLADVIAHSTGTVVAVRKDYRTTDKSGNSYGNYIKIKHEGGYETLYAHMKYNSICVNVGDVVKCGDKIGSMGATGFCFGAHLHFEVRKDGVKIDPTPFIVGNLPEVKREEAKPIEKVEVKNETKETSVLEIVKKTIRGDFGNQPERQKKIESLGFNYEEIRKQVNLNYHNGTTSWDNLKLY